MSILQYYPKISVPTNDDKRYVLDKSDVDVDLLKYKIYKILINI